MAAELAIIIKAKDQASGVLKDAAGNASNLGRNLRTGVGIAALGAAAGVGALVVAGVSFVKQAAAEQASIARLKAALEANGGAWAAHGEAIEKAINERQKLAFSDDDLRDSLSLLIAQTGDHEEALRRQRIAMDFARGAGIDLSAASKLLGKVTDENVNVLARYGIRAEEGMDATELLGRVQEKFAGQSEAYAETATGKWARFNIALDNIKESIGGALLPLVTDLGEQLAIFLEENQDDIEAFVESARVFAQDVAPKIAEFVENKILPQIADAIDEVREAWEQMQPHLEAAYEWLKKNEEVALLLGVALLLLTAYLAGPLIAIPALTAAGVLLLANWDEIKAKAPEVWGDVVAEIEEVRRHFEDIPIVGELIATFLDYVVSEFRAATTIWGAVVQGAFETILNYWQIFKGIWEGDWGAVWEGVKAQLQTSVDMWKTIIGGAFTLAEEIVKSKIEMFSGLGGDIGDALGAGFKSAIVPALNWIIDKINVVIGGYNSIPLAPDVGKINRIYTPSGISGSGPSFMAAGGIVTRPTLAVIGEAGPEAVVPLSGAGAGNDDFIDRLAAALAREIRGLTIEADGRALARVTSRYTAYDADMIGRGG